jgi:hypothetical protein
MMQIVKIFSIIYIIEIMYSIKNQVSYNTKALDKKFKEYDPYVCIPMTKDKKPIISWKGLSETPKRSFDSDHNIAILTGKINQITVIYIIWITLYLNNNDHIYIIR